MSIKIKVTFSFREGIFFLARGKKELEKFHGIIRQAPLSMGILQARILEWVAMPSSGESSQLRDQTQVSSSTGGFFTMEATREAHN